MTVKAESKIDLDLPISMKAVFPVRTEATDVEQESGGSSTEEVEESPRSVAMFRRYVHNQVLRVKEEELLLREDIDGEGCCLNTNIKDRKKIDSCFHERQVKFVVFSRPTTTILPCSPLSGKTERTTGVRAASH
ncbi:hypothetical protein Patl1_22186 [Pistacia atlantica]|uniref:Uncharacterized protein n=1 Tax=Pistacia atlantica TaxID=434234 RepID=A0ACC1BK09_9ROSI|nr:hypothetical protein Patl1_22186 [Pistacia atlantica]